ncbi:hypothetical protein Tco_0269984 [Tanacetum coccineum]
MHNNIMAAGSSDRPPMLAMGRHAQWQSRFMRYVDTKPKSKELKQCILKGPYVMTEVTVPTQPAAENAPAIPANKVAIKRLQQGESLNKQDVNTNLFWEFGKLHQETGNQLSHIKQEWSRFMTIVKQQEKLDIVSYHKLFDILKQYQNEVNEIRAKKLTKNANPLALVNAAHHYLEYHNQAPKPHKPNAPSSRQITSSKSHTITRTKGKEVVKLVTPPSESAFEEDSDEEQAQRDKQI